MKPITTSFPDRRARLRQAARFAPGERLGRCRRAAGLAVLGALAMGLAGCASRYQMGEATSLAVQAMVLAAEQRDAAGGREAPVGGHAARAGERLDTGGGGDDAEQ